MLDKNIALSKQRLEEVVSFFGINADVATKVDEDGLIHLDIDSSVHTPRLIGYHGETLRAIEFLVNQMVKAVDGDAPRISVDVAGYKEARRVVLTELANTVADRVSETGVEEELEPMNPAERRIVHVALSQRSDISTESRGEMKNRRTVILPVKP